MIMETMLFYWFQENKSYLSRSNLLNIRSKIWRRNLNKVLYKYENDKKKCIMKSEAAVKKIFQINYGDEKINPLLRNVVKWSDAL